MKPAGLPADFPAFPAISAYAAYNGNDNNIERV
jgi:hypothetical protein